MESYDKIKKVLALGFMNFLDENKPKDKMCLSNGECADIEKAFNEQDWPKLARYLDKYTENEDDRIMKILSDIFADSGDRFISEYERTKVVSWLEKQKENPKSADSISADCVSSAKCEDRSPKHTDSFGTDIRDTPAYWRGWDDAMKQKEQKPNYCHHEVDETGWTEEYRKAYYDGWNNCNMQHEQLKADQKPAEWSEEDEKKREFLIKGLEDRMGFGWTSDPFSREELISWLENLRPSWKPSKQQMEALHEAVIRSCSHHYGVELSNLEIDLLKLK